MNRSLEQTKIAKRYVYSLFDAIEAKKDQATAAKDIADLGAMIAASTELQNFISTPIASLDDQKAGMMNLAKKAKFSVAVTNLLSVLADNRRLNVLPAIVSEAEKYQATQSGTVPVAVATARKLSATDQKKIGADIKAVLGKDVVMQAYVDESLIGGMVVQVESTLIDGSVKTKLEKLERQMTRGNAAA